MNVLIDENVPNMTVDALRSMSFDVREVYGTSDQGMSDEDIWTMAQHEQRLLITTDKGFVRHRSEPHYGLIVVRLRQPNRLKIHQRILQALTQFAAEEWRGTTIIVRDAVQSVWHAAINS